MTGYFHGNSDPFQMTVGLPVKAERVRLFTPVHGNMMPTEMRNDDQTYK